MALTPEKLKNFGFSLIPRALADEYQQRVARRLDRELFAFNLLLGAFLCVFASMGWITAAFTLDRRCLLGALVVWLGIILPYIDKINADLFDGPEEEGVWMVLMMLLMGAGCVVGVLGLASRVIPHELTVRIPVIIGLCFLSLTQLGLTLLGFCFVDEWIDKTYDTGPGGHTWTLLENMPESLYDGTRRFVRVAPRAIFGVSGLRGHYVLWVSQDTEDWFCVGIWDSHGRAVQI